MTPEQRRRAGRAVGARIGEMSATTTTVARAAGITPKTLRAFLHAQRWPTDAVQERIEVALGWHPGEIVVHAVQGGIDGALDALTDTELAAELLRRLADRDRHATQRRTRRAAR